ncbi:MAG: RagB/SusD family nutrient uptake outer membrane protein [Muribaculaceae bacterium]|nr:RagB/SusD family nutrient uptake outer membrane protein [Muribaculaceae bacterium]
MKYTKIFLAAACTGVLFSACNDLDQEPMSNIVTQIQKEEIVSNDPEMVSAAVNTLPSMVRAYMNTFETHQDFGWPSMMLILDSRGQDMPSNLGGYQWYTAALEFSDFGGSYYNNLYYWYTNYNLIRSSNAVASVIAADTEDSESQYFLAQALCFRAWAYFNLTQMYAWTYAKDPNDLSVPLVLDTNMNETASAGCARATVEEVYQQVLSDLDNGIALLEKAEKSGVKRSTMAGSASLTKTFFNPTAAYAMRARAELFHCDWVKCAEDCQKALDLAAAEGLRPYNRQELAAPRFVNIQDASWILGIYVDPSTSLANTIASFPSFMSAWTSGYASEGFFRCINKSLYEGIPATDVRKGWWLDGNGKEPSTLPPDYANIISSAKIKWSPYAQIKFGATNSESALFATDVPLMRVEELYLMLAEAQGRVNQANGVATLTSFVKDNRDPNYEYKANDFVDEVWRQRRIELWGEGFSYWDIMRLQKPIDRRGGGYLPELVFNISPDNTVLLFDIPQSEAQRNPKIVKPSRNSTIPQPVSDN